MKRASKAELSKLTESADSITSLRSGFGLWKAIVHKAGQNYLVKTESLNPVGRVWIEEISAERASSLMRK